MRCAAVTRATRSSVIVVEVKPSISRSPWLRGALGAFALGMVALSFRETSMTRAFARIDAGLALLFVPTLQGIGFCIEASGWRAILRTLGARVGFFAVLRARIVSEAIAQSLPLGVLVAEGSKPLLLRAYTGVALPTGAASVAARKYSLVASQAVLLALVALLGRVAGGGSVRLVIGAGALVLATSAALSGRALRSGALADAVRRRLERLPFLGSLAKRHRTEVGEADRAAGAYFKKSLRERMTRALPFFVAWCVEAIETYVLLHFVGVDVSLYEAFSIEVPLGLLRSVAFFAPAGLGVQDLGYATVLASLGVPDAASAALAFAFLKRAKELFWVTVGYTLLLTGRSRESDRVPAAVANATGTAA